MGVQSVAVIIPALNEEDSLPRVLADLPVSTSASGGVIVVDNGSVDRTAEVAVRGGAHVVREERRGYGSAMLRGLRELDHRWPDTQVVVFLDGDYSDHPE